MNVPHKYLRFFSVLFLLVCLLTACGRAPAAVPTVDTPAAEPAADTGLRDDIVILYTNDLHTYIDGPLSFDTVAAIKQELARQYTHVLLADAGDHSQGTAYGSMDEGKSITALMNATGYDVATLGNHEFDYGLCGHHHTGSL